MPQIALTRRQLRIIQDANRQQTEIMMLLREIKRLRSVLTTLHDLVLRAGNAGMDDMLDILDEAEELLNREPCIAERVYDANMRRMDSITVKRNTTPRGPRYHGGEII